MQRVSEVWNASVLGRVLAALSLWFGGQWRRSRVVQAFLSPQAGAEHSRGSVFYRLWEALRSGLDRIYRAMHLNRLFEGSIFQQCWFWCALPVALAPLIDVFHPSILVLAMVLVGYGSLLLNLLRDRARELRFSPMNRFILLYAAVYLGATLGSVNFRGSLEPGLLSVAFILFSLVLCTAVTNRTQLDTLVALLVLAAALVSCYGILQYLFGWGYQSKAWVDSDMFSTISFRVPSTLDNPNMLGQYLILMIPLGGAKLLSAKTLLSRLYYLGCCGLMCVCMVLTFSRGAWLGLLLAGAAFLILLNPRFIFLAPVALVLLYFALPASVVARFTSIGNMRDNSTSYRVFIWMGVLAMLRDGYWLCGIGPGDAAFNLVYPAYGFSAIEAPHAHNLYLQIVCDAGIAALCVFLVILFQFFRCMCIALKDRSDWDSRVLQIAFVSGTGGFLVQAMTDYSFYNYRVMFLFWAYLALGYLSTVRKELPEGRLLL